VCLTPQWVPLAVASDGGGWCGCVGGSGEGGSNMQRRSLIQGTKATCKGDHWYKELSKSSLCHSPTVWRIWQCARRYPIWCWHWSLETYFLDFRFFASIQLVSNVLVTLISC
jgi:hypothetical protein